MVNTRAKGNRTIRKFKELFGNNFDFMQNVEDKSPFASVKDLFGLFDMVALRADEYFFIQFKTNKFDTNSKFMTFTKNHTNPYIRVLQVCWFDRLGFKIREYSKFTGINTLDFTKLNNDETIQLFKINI